MPLADMSAFQWLTLGLGTVGFLLTWTGMVVSITRAVTSIKADTSERITEETKKVTERVTCAIEKFDEDQRTQDSRFGEVALGIRQKVADVEKEMHAIEIWGRDNYVLKNDFKADINRLETMFLRCADDIKRDVRQQISMLLKTPPSEE